ncbi:MAG: cellulase family glycosylhydrolase [Ruminococcus sp.]|nr:cellulase family glycosylhydrolase [Ruminococcus sp.]
MKFSVLKKITAVLSATAITALSSVCPVPNKAADAAPDEYHDDWLHVNENAEIVDMDGNPVWLTGCNWFGYNVGSQVFDGVWSVNMHDCLNLIADHGFNLLRVPMSTQILLQWKNNEPDPIIKVNEWKNPELTVEGIAGGKVKYSFDIWNMAVNWCRENGIKIMMDIHSPSTNASGHQIPLWYDENYSTEDWLEALEWFCDYYKDDDTIIAIDLKNEPHGKPEDGRFAKWDNSTDLNNWKYAAERGANACLSQNPNLLIMVEGTECYPKFDEGADWSTPSIDYANYGKPSKVWGAWWGGNLRGVRDYPIDLGEYQSQLVYSPHDYGPEVHPQEWFYLKDDTKTFTRQTLLDDYWRGSWAYIAEEKIAPLLMGEWGGWVDEEHDKTGENRHWLQEIRDYMIDMHIHHTFWCFNENSSDTGGLVYDNFEKWDDVKYEFVKPALWQTEDGKFISLDHKIKIGANGISLGDYYSGSSSSQEESKTTTTTTTAEIADVTTVETETVADDILYGDANLDGKVSISDAVRVLQYIANASKYSLESQALANADVDGSKGVTGKDAAVIQQYDAGVVKTLPL